MDGESGGIRGVRISITPSGNSVSGKVIVGSRDGSKDGSVLGKLGSILGAEMPLLMCSGRIEPWIEEACDAC